MIDFYLKIIAACYTGVCLIIRMLLVAEKSIINIKFVPLLKYIEEYFG